MLHNSDSPCVGSFAERSNSRGMRSNSRAGLARFCIGRRNILTIQRVFIASGTLKAFASNEPSSVLAFRFGALIRRCNTTRECSFNFHKLFPIIIKHASYHDSHAQTTAARRRPRRPKRHEQKGPVASLISRREFFENTSRWRISFSIVASLDPIVYYYYLIASLARVGLNPAEDWRCTATIRGWNEIIRGGLDSGRY